MGEVDGAMVLSQASGGRALRGLGMNDVSKQILLSPPSGLSLMGCSQPAFSIAYCFSAAEESSSFCKDVIAKGWSLATKLHAHVWLGVSVGGSSGVSKHKGTLNEGMLTRKVSEACITQCVYIPMKCFQIPRSKMTLCEAALSRARSIMDATDADDFLKAFNSHVSENMYCLGGIFFKEVTVRCMEHTTLSNLMSQAERELNGSAGTNLLGLQLFEAKAGGQRQTCTDSISSQGSALMLESSTHKVTILGPTTAADDKEFVRKLNDDPLCWAIIDKDIDGKEGLVSVWELLLDHAQSLAAAGLPDDTLKYKRAAKFLCERWLKITRASLQNLSSPGERDPLYGQLLLQSSHFLSRLSADPIFLMGKQPQLEDAPLLPLPSNLIEEASLGDLIQQLQKLVEQAEINVGHKAANHVRYFIKSSKGSPKVATVSLSVDDLKHRKALDIFVGYGFDVNGNLVSELHVDQLRSMIHDLNEIQNFPRQEGRIVPFAWTNATKISSAICTPEPASKYQYRYVGDVLVDRDFYNDPYQHMSHAHDFKHAAAHRFISCLRHHINPHKHLLLQAPSQAPRSPMDDWDCAFEDEEAEEEEGSKASMVDQESDLQLQQLPPLELLIHIFQASDLPAQIALCNFLLSQRAATPLVLPSHPPIPPQEGLVVPLSHFMNALSFVEVNLEKGKVCIATDTTLPRVVFLSNKRVHTSHAAIVASRVLSCDFISQHSRREMGQMTQIPVIEVGVGFLNSQGQGKSQCLACLAFHVTGPYLQLMDFITAIADVLVLELEQGQSHPALKTTSTAKVLRWQETEVTEGADKKKMLLWGQESYLVGEIRNFLHSASLRVMDKSRESLRAVCIRQIPTCPLISFEELQGLVGQCDFQSIRSSLKLQSSFVEEAQSYFELLQLKGNPSEKQVRRKRCDQEKERRIIMAKDVMSNPIIQLFHQLLAEGESTSRRVQIMWLERTLSEKMYPILEEAARRANTMLEVCNRNSKDAQAKQDYIKAKQEYIEKNLGVVNLWRELCHIFEADPVNQRDLAKKAAQHLLDGFPLEILDGDAGMFSKTWVDSVLAELDMVTTTKLNKPAKIFVLSVMGLQSSGKSTILNRMFGANLQTSAGRCTRGVYIQLVPSERAEYDYVMLLDTEGIRSPEYFGLEAAEVRDNRLATLGLLPANASIFMVSNEDDTGLKEVLPMVLLAFKGSAMAESSGGRIKAKMLFVYRSVDTNDVKKLMGNKQKLHEYLKEAAEQVANVGVSSTKEPDLAAGCECELLQSVFTDFRVHEDETKSDVKCMGNLKKGFVPPSDTPDWAYGEQVVALREYIHKRVMDDGWEPRSFKEWGRHLTMVWECICSADFELSFRSEMEYSSYRELQARLQPPHRELLQKYMDVFESLEMTVRTMKEDESGTALISIMEASVEDLVRCKSAEVDGILQMKRWAKWRAREQDDWKHFCATTKESYKRRLVDMESGVVRFEKVVTDYEKQIKRMILQMMEKGEWKMEQSKEIMRQRFDKIFDSILLEAEKSHPPIANEVPFKVMQRYKQAGLTDRFDLYATSPTTDHGLLSGNQRSWEPRKTSHGNQRSWFSEWPFYGQEKGDRLQELYSNLQTVIDRQLRDARQYSEVIVDSVISETVGKLQERRYQMLSRKEQGDAHIRVKEILIEKMQGIQRRWDEDHNVAQKLRLKAAPRLYQFFEARTEGLEATTLLIGELRSILEDELEEAHSLLVVKKVAARLRRANWVMDWHVMMEFLDYHLLILMETKNVDKLLRYVSNGTLHFQEMTNVLIGQAIDHFLEKEWGIIVQKVVSCLKEQCALDEDRPVGEFLAGLARRLDTDVDSKMANSVLSSINLDYYKERVLDADFFQNKVPGLCESIIKKPLGQDVDKMRGALIERVRKRMEDMQDENCRPRCGAKCPWCGSTCFHCAGHSQKHDCIHQPAGLNGVLRNESKEFAEQTCLEQFEAGRNMILKGAGRPRRVVPWSEFEKEYPLWTKPGKKESTAMQVRECIFFNYQDALVEFYKESMVKTFGQAGKPCSYDHMPLRYNHNSQHLRTALYNSLRSNFENESAWNQFLELF